MSPRRATHHRYAVSLAIASLTALGVVAPGCTAPPTAPTQLEAVQDPEERTGRPPGCSTTVHGVELRAEPCES